MASLLEIREAVQANLARERAPSTEDAAVTRWINHTIREEICAEHYWHAMFARKTVFLTAAVDFIAWPEPLVWKSTKLIGWRTGTNSFSKVREATDPQYFYDARRGSAGAPRHWLKAGDGFYVAPVADQSAYYEIELIGWRYLYDLAQDSDTNYFTNKHSGMLEWGATARGWLIYGEPAKAGRWLDLYNRALARARRNDLEDMLPFEATLVPGGGAGTQRAPRGRRMSPTNQPYDWV